MLFSSWGACSRKKTSRIRLVECHLPQADQIFLLYLPKPLSDIRILNQGLRLRERREVAIKRIHQLRRLLFENGPQLREPLEIGSTQVQESNVRFDFGRVGHCLTGSANVGLRQGLI